MFTALADRTTARPKRTLLAVVLFVVIAGVFGGPVAGALADRGGFTANDSGSARAVDRIEAATGTQAAPGVVALIARRPAPSPRGRERVAAVQRRSRREPGIASVARPRRRATRVRQPRRQLHVRRRHARAGADEDAVFDLARRALRGHRRRRCSAAR